MFVSLSKEAKKAELGVNEGTTAPAPVPVRVSGLMPSFVEWEEILGFGEDSTA